MYLFRCRNTFSNTPERVHFHYHIYCNYQSIIILLGLGRNSHAGAEQIEDFTYTIKLLRRLSRFPSYHGFLISKLSFVCRFRTRCSTSATATRSASWTWRRARWARRPASWRPLRARRRPPALGRSPNCSEAWSVLDYTVISYW